MMTILHILGWAAFGWLMTVAEPILLLRWVTNLLEEEEGNLIQNFFVRLLSCPMCVSFWIGLFAMQSFAMGALVALVARAIDDHFGDVPLR